MDGCRRVAVDHYLRTRRQERRVDGNIFRGGGDDDGRPRRGNIACTIIVDDGVSRRMGAMMTIPRDIMSRGAQLEGNIDRGRTVVVVNHPVNRLVTVLIIVLCVEELLLLLLVVQD